MLFQLHNHVYGYIISLFTLQQQHSSYVRELDEFDQMFLL